MPSELERRRFCSQACAGASRRGMRKKAWARIECLACGKDFEVTPAWARSGRRKYCSRTCHGRANLAGRRRGVAHTDEARGKMRDAATGKFLRENSSQWKGGRFRDRSGYVHVMVEGLPEPDRTLARQTTGRRYILEHRAVAATILGRPLRRDEIVHHLNGVKDDNRPENLMVVERGVHSREHREVERRLAALEAENARLREEVSSLRSSRS